MHDAADTYAARQWSVIPVGDNKRPLVAWQEYQQRICGAAEREAWWQRWPGAGVGVITGAVSGLLVVDVDAGDADKFAAARSKLETLVPDGLVTPTARTRRGGLHYYFKRPPAGMGNRAHVAGYSIDVRCDGGYVVAAPTPGYTWVVAPEACELAEVPPALLEFLQAHKPASTTASAPPALPPARVANIVVERARRYVATMEPAISGSGGHNATFRAACVLIHGFALDESDAWDVLCEYNGRQCVPPWSERELRHKLESARDCTTHEKPRGHLLGDGRGPRAPAGPGEERDSNEGREPGDAAPVELAEPQPGARRARPVIHIGTDEYRVVAEAIDALAAQRHYYQRGPSLVRVVQDAAPPGEARPPARIDIVPHSSLEVALSAAAKWEKLKATKDEETWIPAQPPKWAVQGVATARGWRGIPPLVGVVSMPVLRRDGTLLTVPGYDAESGLWYKPISAVASVPDEPTPEQAAAARDLLLSAVSDFPFAGDMYRAAWLALVLTPFARHAMTDGCPLGYIDANTRGSGKSLLATVTGLIGTGRRVPMAAWPEEEEEREKRITTYVLEGAGVVVFDNCEHTIGGQTVNAILTANSWIGRILGRSQSTGEMPLRTFFMATGNNCDFAADTCRRTIHIRLKSPLEHPEQRTDFSHPDLLAWAAEQRPRLAAAALTILRGYQAAGCPDMRLPAMGGFTDWHRFVRGAVVWCGMPDPVKTQEELTRTADRSVAELAALLDGIWTAQAGSAEFCSTKQLLVIADLPGGERLHDALLEHAPSRRGGLPDPRVLGKLLRRHVDRVHGGMVIRRRVADNQSLWRVVPSE